MMFALPTVSSLVLCSSLSPPQTPLSLPLSLLYPGFSDMRQALKCNHDVASFPIASLRSTAKGTYYIMVYTHIHNTLMFTGWIIFNEFRQVVSLVNP